MEASGKMRKAVLLTYTFPPQTSGATPVIMNMVKYLPAFGWEVLPLTASNPSGIMPMDPSLRDRLPGNLKVTKVIHPDPMQFLSHLKGRNGKVQPPADNRISKNRGFLNRLIHNYLLVPDRVITWLPTVIPAGAGLIEREQADLIISHGPHHSTHILARILSRMAGIPHVAYFGDLWIYDSNSIWDSKFNFRLEKALEGLVVKHADGILASTPESVDYFRKEYGDSCPPAETLDNGYDPETTIPESSDDANRDYLLLTFTGNFWGEHSPKYIFAGVREVLKDWPDAPLKLQLIGSLAPRFRHLPEEYGIGSNLIMKGVVPFSEITKYQMESDVLLACLSPLRGSEVKNSSKTAEYLRSGKPIFAVAPEGTMTGYVKKFNAGYTAEPDAKSIARVIRKIISDWQNDTLKHTSDFEGIAKVFDGKRIMQRVGKFLDGMLGSVLP